MIGPHSSTCVYISISHSSPIVGCFVQEHFLLSSFSFVSLVRKGEIGSLIEEKALDQTFYGHHYDHQQQRLDRYNSLEEKISEFLNNGYADSDATDDYGSDDNESIDALQHDLYWESQEALLQEILERYALVGAKLRQEINGIIEEARETVFCSCKNQKQTQKQSPRTEAGCINCLRMRVIHLLCRRGLNATLCVSKWKHIKNHRAGTHEYIKVIASTRAEEADPICDRTGVQGRIRDRESMRRVHETGRQITGVLRGEVRVPQPHCGSDVR
ncbi:uncharacterized protein LOC120158918 [Hibiscus syriacus]|uniref:uncharacterized protein LOC120158918 n=1 Tax=Hibiscus syriacus TaxID=106335 RepID=UPI0019244AD5|nr:uncharacterized protein LOC120158918 [Hibiscus syriacus]